VTHETRRLVEWLRAGLARATGRRYRINLDEFEVVSEWSHGVGSDHLEGSGLRVSPNDPAVLAQARQVPGELRDDVDVVGGGKRQDGEPDVLVLQQPALDLAEDCREFGLRVIADDADARDD
jgi:hypothetical protein